jgi:hypothetical protein
MTSAHRPRHKMKPRLFQLDAFLKDDLAGAHVVARGLTARQIIDMAAGKLQGADIITAITEVVVEHNLDPPDITRQDVSVLMDLLNALNAAQQVHAFPPVEGEPSSGRSPATAR